MKTTSKFKTAIAIVWINGLIFIVLKLFKIVLWPWIWVLCPFWISIGLIALAMILIVVFACIAAAVSSDIDRY